MRSILFATLSVIGFAASGAFAQTDVYFGGSVGYDFGIPGERLGTDYSGLTKSNSSTASGSSAYSGNVSSIFGSLAGKSTILSGKLGAYSKNIHLGGELGLDYFMGAKQDVEKASSSYNYGNNETTTFSCLFLRPQFLFRAGSFGSVVPYLKAGLVLGVNPSLKSIENTDDTTTYESDWSGNWAWGLSGTLGIEYQLNENLGIFMEADMESIGWKPQKDHFTSKSSDTTYQYADETSYAEYYNDTKFLSRDFSLSNLSAKVGLNYHF